MKTMDREKEAIDKLKEYGQNHIVNILEKLQMNKPFFRIILRKKKLQLRIWQSY